MKKTILMIGILTALTGCAVKKSYGTRGGSKADGTVKMSYTYGGFEVPTVDESQALESAIRRCKGWGYSGAESFDFVDKKCQSMGQYGCDRWLVTKEFQCK